MRERVFPSILFLAVSVKMKKKTVSRYCRVLNYDAVCCQQINALKLDDQTIGTIVKRKYSAACLVKSYNAVFVEFLFCAEKTTSPQIF